MGKLGWDEKGWARQGQTEQGTVPTLRRNPLGGGGLAYSTHQESRNRRADRLTAPGGRAGVGSERERRAQ